MLKEKFISAVIVAAGSSTRMNSSVRKPLMKIGDRAVLQHTVSAFEESKIIDEIVIVCPEDDIPVFKELLSEINLKRQLIFTAGGSTRQKSVRNGVAAVSGCCDVVAIHDGARPLIKPEHIFSVVSDALDFGAAVLAVPAKDTIKIVENAEVISTPPREKLFLIQTPQVFEKNKYIEAYEKAQKEGLDLTDDCQLIEAAGGKIHITAGDYTNIKITTPEDIFIAEALLKLR